MQTQTLTGEWQFRQAGTEEWLPARVPGGVHTDLLAAGRIPDPFVGDNEARVQWVAEADWEYRCRFACSPELLAEAQVWLVCDGLDTLAAVSLNGRLLGHTENMFRQYRWEVRELLHASDAQPGAQPNELAIAFTSPVRFITEQQSIRLMFGVLQGILGAPHLRKAPSQFGWDWGPQLPPIGVWKEIRLEGYRQARIEAVHLRQEHAAGQVVVSARVSVEPCSPALPTSEARLRAVLRLTAPDGKVLQGEAPVAPGGGVDLRLPVAQPELWWPNGYGAQPLYQVEVCLRSDGAGEASILDRRQYQLGLRTIALRQEADEWGRSFVFVVNGIPIFAKGSNWIPADSFPTRLSGEHLEGLVRAAAESHQNMLRVWGGGFYEEERFYDLCDRYGLLVWQDFVFACSIYPMDDPAFIENVRGEVVENIRRLRHRASLALWCGNNEMEWGWADWGWKYADLPHLQAAYLQFFHHTLPAWCAAEDPDHSYWPSSPSSDTPFEDPNGQRQGDAHYWDVWHGRKPFSAYRSQFPRFMSEFGFQALAPLATIRSYAQEADWDMKSSVMLQHQKNDNGNELILAQMKDNFRMPKDFPSLVYLSMLLQAEGVRYGVEHWRRHKERVAGTLYWQLNDCWPVTSWSSLDYFGRWKALHYAARRFYAPLLLSIEDHPTRQAIYLTSDLGEAWEGELRWALETLAGQALLSGQEAVQVAPFASLRVCDLDFAGRLLPQGPGGPDELILVAELLQGGRRVALQVGAFVPTKDLALADPAITAALRNEAGRLEIDLAAQSLARLVEFSLEGAEVVFSDNYFDLPAGRQVTVSCPLPPGWTLDQARQALRIRSVYDTYA